LDLERWFVSLPLPVGRRSASASPDRGWLLKDALRQKLF
jgi:hypothetical protein